MSSELQGAKAQEVVDAPAGGLLSGVLKATRESERDTVKSALGEFIKGIMGDAKTVDKDVIRTLDKFVTVLDEKLTRQLRAIMHSDKFRKLEGTWRGLGYLVFNSETAVDLKVKLLCCSKKELSKDLERAVEFDQSVTFQKIYRDEFGTAGGEPFAAIVGDYEIENNEDDLSMLSKMSNVSAAGFCPFLTSPAPSLFQFDNWTELPNPRDLALTFTGPKYIKWNSFRESEDSRFVVMAMPRVLARSPYGAGGKRIEEFNFEEADLAADGTPNSMIHNQFCWMNAAYVLGTKLTAAYAETGFCTRILGVQSGGKVEDLPVFAYKESDGTLDMKCPTEINIDDRRANELAGLGFMPLVHWKNKDYAAFITGDTCQKPKVYDRAQANENAQASAWLPYIMATGRFSHFIKSSGRDWLGSFKEKEDLEDALNRFIMNYVCLNDRPNEKQKAELPLADARVEVLEVPGELGAFSARIWMRPWTQLRELTASMSMVTRIPKAAGG